jgi:hypothetical protein
MLQLVSSLLFAAELLEEYFLQEKKTEIYLPNATRTVVLGLIIQLHSLPENLFGLHNPKMWHVFLKKILPQEFKNHYAALASV